MVHVPTNIALLIDSPAGVIFLNFVILIDKVVLPYYHTNVTFKIAITSMAFFFFLVAASIKKRLKKR